MPPDAERVATLERHQRLQQDLGVRVEMLDPPALKRRFPSVEVGDLGAASLSPEDGWLDPNAVLQGLRKKARSLGAIYLRDRVVALEASGNLVRSARLASGAVVEASHFVICAGPWAKEVCAMLGIPLPVEPMRRFDTYFEYRGEIEPLPYIKDLSRLAMRPEGRGFTAGLVDWNEPRGFNFDVDHSYFQSVVWPAAAHTVRAIRRAMFGKQTKKPSKVRQRNWQTEAVQRKVPMQPVRLLELLVQEQLMLG